MQFHKKTINIFRTIQQQCKWWGPDPYFVAGVSVTAVLLTSNTASLKFIPLRLHFGKQNCRFFSVPAAN